jgi:hypothetical protein
MGAQDRVAQRPSAARSSLSRSQCDGAAGDEQESGLSLTAPSAFWIHAGGQGACRVALKWMSATSRPVAWS